MHNNASSTHYLKMSGTCLIILTTDHHSRVKKKLKRKRHDTKNEDRHGQDRLFLFVLLHCVVNSTYFLKSALQKL